MTLEMKSYPKQVRFEYRDEDASTVVQLLPDDDQDTLIRKMKRVIALVEAPLQLEPLERLKRHTQEEAIAGVQKGFPAFHRPKIPEHLKGEVELEEPAAPGNGWAAPGAGE